MASRYSPEVREQAAKMLNDMLSVVDVRSIVTYDPLTKQHKIEGKIIDAGRVSNLRAEANFILESDIWKLMYETPKALAERAMFVNGESLDDLKKGRSMLYTLSTQKNILDIFGTYPQVKK